MVLYLWSQWPRVLVVSLGTLYPFLGSTSFWILITVPLSSTLSLLTVPSFLTKPCASVHTRRHCFQRDGNRKERPFSLCPLPEVKAHSQNSFLLLLFFSCLICVRDSLVFHCIQYGIFGIQLNEELCTSYWIGVVLPNRGAGRLLILPLCPSLWEGLGTVQ